VCVIIIISIIIIITIIIIIIIINKQVLLQCHRVQKTSRALNNRKIKAMTVSCQLKIRLSEIKGQLKSRVFSRRLKATSDGDVSDGRQTIPVETQKAWSPTLK